MKKWLVKKNEYECKIAKLQKRCDEQLNMLNKYEIMNNIVDIDVNVLLKNISLIDNVDVRHVDNIVACVNHHGVDVNISCEKRCAIDKSECVDVHHLARNIASSIDADIREYMETHDERPTLYYNALYMQKNAYMSQLTFNFTLL